MRSASHHVKIFSNLGKLVFVFDSNTVEFSIVNTQTHVMVNKAIEDVLNIGSSQVSVLASRVEVWLIQRIDLYTIIHGKP